MIGVGTVLQDRYEVLRPLGRGGTADVFGAHDRSLNREVAIKVVRGTTAGERQRLEREARMLAGFEHPNLVRIFDAQHSAEDAYVVLEYVNGHTLAELIAQQALPAGGVAQVGSEIADALGYIHSRSVVHRDVKPSNIFVGADGRSRLSDFGIARHESDAQLTQTGMIIGTGAYMAPEQVEARVVGPPADIYALGLVLFECLTGAPVYTGPAAEAAIARLTRDPDVTTVPAAWGPLLAAMTAREPDARPRASAVTEHLRLLASGSRGDTHILPVAPTTITAAPPSSPRRGGRERVLVLAGIALLVGLLALFALTRGNSQGSFFTDESTTTSTVVVSTTTTKPTTTTSRCDQQQAQRDALDEQEQALDDRLKGKALDQAKRQIEAQKRALDQAMATC